MTTVEWGCSQRSSWLLGAAALGGDVHAPAGAGAPGGVRVVGVLDVRGGGGSEGHAGRLLEREIESM